MDTCKVQHLKNCLELIVVAFQKYSRAWQLYIQQWIEGHFKKVSVFAEEGYRLTSTFRLQELSTPAQRTQTKAGSAGKQPLLERSCLWRETIYWLFPNFIFDAFSFITRWSLDWQSAIHYANFLNRNQGSYPIELTPIWFFTLTLAIYYV